MLHVDGRLGSRLAMLATLCLLFVSMGGCAHAGAHPRKPGLINHSVFIKLKDPAQTNELLADCDLLIAKIPGLTAAYAGRSLEAGRPEVDTSFDVGFFVAFESEEDYQRYDDHPAHRAAAEKWKPRCQSIRICDVRDPTP
jgi:hypothetical protein